jgi:hypothetical protein
LLLLLTTTVDDPCAFAILYVLLLPAANIKAPATKKFLSSAEQQKKTLDKLVDN